MGIWSAFFNRQNRNREQEYINQLFRVACADGSLDEIEVAYIYSVGEKLGMTKEELVEARENYNSDTLAYTPPRNREQRFFMLFYLINMIRADDVIHPEEMRITENIVMKLGYTADTVDTILSAIDTNQKQGISPEETYAHLTEQLK